ncbi:MAG TPA: CobD/CbiB family protein [Rhodocyclaceae bacterium]|nr:CobD/CbiB family protein [Rhodocyclaceae bacterium]
MTLLSLILALILEQFRPLNAAKHLHHPLELIGQFFENRFNDGQAHHGRIAWCLMVLPPVLLSAVVYFLLFSLHPLAAFAFNVAMLYYTMGFRHVSHFFTHIHAALRAQDLDRARELIAQWRGCHHDLSGTQEITRLTIEQGLIGAHRQVFAIIVLFVILPGPSGAVLYRMADYYAHAWGKRTGPESWDPRGEFGKFATKAFAFIEWLPARVTAMAFGIVGDFEDAVYCWRMQAPLWADRNEGILLASGAGALGVRLGLPIHQSGEIINRPELGMGDDAEVEYLQSTVGLIRRTLVLNVVVLALLWITRLAS